MRISHRIQRFRMLLVPLATVGLLVGTAPAVSATTGLSYQGGDVISVPALYIDYWGSTWNTGFSDGGAYTNVQAKNYLNQFFGSVGGSAWLSTVKQYSGIANPPGQLKGTWVDNVNPVPPASQFSKNFVENEAHNAYNHWGGGSYSAVFLIVTSNTQPKPYDMGSTECGYHNHTPVGSTNVEYAYLPYLPNFNCYKNRVFSTNDSFGHGWFDGFSIVGGHEYAEAITDANGAWVQNLNGCFTALTGPPCAEIGDMCTEPQGYSTPYGPVLLDQQEFAVQGLWSNAIGGCTTQQGACLHWTLNSAPANSARFIDRDGSVNYSDYGIDTWVDACGDVYFDSWTSINGTAWPQWMYSALHVVRDGVVVFDSYTFVGTHAPKTLTISSPIYSVGHNYSYQDSIAKYGRNYSWNPAWNPTEPQTSLLVNTYP